MAKGRGEGGGGKVWRRRRRKKKGFRGGEGERGTTQGVNPSRISAMTPAYYSPLVVVGPALVTRLRHCVSSAGIVRVEFSLCPVETARKSRFFS